MVAPGHDGPPSPAEVCRDYLAALLAADVNRARAVIGEAVEAGLAPSELYLDVFQEALHEVGRLWQSGEATIAQEHLATATTQALMARVCTKLGAAPRGELRALIAATEHDYHALGSRFLADFLEAEGWTVLELGAATPTESLVRLAEELQPAVVCLSTTLEENLPHARAAIARLGELEPRPLIAVGGQAYGGRQSVAAELGADLFATDALEFIAALRCRLGEPV